MDSSFLAQRQKHEPGKVNMQRGDKKRVQS